MEYSALTKAERREVIDAIQVREPHLTRAQARRREVWLTGSRNSGGVTANVGSTIPLRHGGGFAVDYSFFVPTPTPRERNGQ